MKKIILLSCCFLFLITSEQLQAQLNFAVHAGANIGSITYKWEEETIRNANHIGIRVGLIAEYQITEKMALHTGVIYSQKGAKEKDSNDDWTETNKLTINYLDLPLLIKYNIGKAYILGGITLGYALSGKTSYEYTEDGDTESNSQSLDIGNSENDDYGSLDGALTLGLGYQINHDIHLNAFYNHGIIDIAAIKEGDVTTGIIGIGVSYFFNSKNSGGKTRRNNEDADDDWDYEEEDYEEENNDDDDDDWR